MTKQDGLVYLFMLYTIYILFASRMSWNISNKQHSWVNSASVTSLESWASTTTATSWNAIISTQSNSWFQGTTFLILWVIMGLIIGWLVAKIIYVQNKSNDRKLAVQQSKATTLWYVSEKIAPLLPNFPYSYKDLVFLGKGVDYLCFDGLAEWHVKKIVFLEIKTGKSMLNKNEQLIKSAIDTGKVHWETIRL